MHCNTLHKWCSDKLLKYWVNWLWKQWLRYRLRWQCIILYNTNKSICYDKFHILSNIFFPMMAYFCLLHARYIMSTCNIIMLTCDLFMAKCSIIMLTCCIIMLTCDLKSHVNITMLHVDIMYPACRERTISFTFLILKCI